VRNNPLQKNPQRGIHSPFLMNDVSETLLGFAAT
jgi:hypothetical protein